MSQPNIPSNHNLLPRTAYSITPTDYLADFKQAISSFVQAWHNYQPDDSLATERKQDLEWLKLKLRDYRLNIHNSSNSYEFWKGFMEGKYNRRTLSNQPPKSLTQILIKAITSTKTQQTYDLGVEVGWCYARLKDYLQRIKKQRKLEEAQQLQDYQQISKLIHRTDDTDSLLSVGWVRERKSDK
ncbi:hypothetical protein [Argonema antarcticum]|uniref:hypothetical protein n=1 Tax=Argonema antarcticum TaxID=2942763 RepID=UPI00201161EB|nr:hypothetical protein [Argonema antarcticum]MCL1472026.1 hypothetical protein [Argonema antarcticum A004/B2]